MPRSPGTGTILRLAPPPAPPMPSIGGAVVPWWYEARNMLMWERFEGDGVMARVGKSERERAQQILIRIFNEIRVPITGIERVPRNSNVQHDLKRKII